MHRYLSILFSLMLTTLSLSAQNDCNYQLILNDVGEDGWNGAGISLYVETVVSNYTINGATDTINIPLVEGDSISLSYQIGIANEDNNFQLLDSDGQVVVAETNPAAGVLFEGFASCPICPAIVLGSVVNVDSFDNRVMIDWEPSDSLGIYQIEYARCGFLNNPDSVQVAMSTVSSATINNLDENTCYEYQISLVCLGGTQSINSAPKQVTTIFTNDVGISGAFAPQYGQKCDFLAEDTLFVFLKNYGAAPQTLVPFDFTIVQNISTTGGMVTMPEDGLYTGVLTKDSCVAFPFEELIDISEPGEYTITMYTSLDTDSNISNDSFTYVFSHTQLLPFFEQFNNDELPERWTTDEESAVFAGQVSSELGPLNSKFVLTTDRYGRISGTDSLGFDFTLSELNDSSTPATLTAGDQLLVEVSNDCGESYQAITTIDMSNFDTSQSGLQTLKFSLADYSDQLVNFRFTALRGGSSFRLVLDDINVYECGVNSSLIVDSNISNVTLEEEDDGTILVSPLGGIAPYTFQWSTGFTEMGETSTLTNVGSGLYSVTITDAQQCNIVSDYNVGTVSTDQLADVAKLDIYPNPAQSILNVDISLSKAQSLDVRIFNTLGQSMWTNSLPAEEQHILPISVSKFNAGIYFIQISSTSGQITKRFIVD